MLTESDERTSFFLQTKWVDLRVTCSKQLDPSDPTEVLRYVEFRSPCRSWALDCL